MASALFCVNKLITGLLFGFTCKTSTKPAHDRNGFIEINDFISFNSCSR